MTSLSPDVRYRLAIQQQHELLAEAQMASRIAAARATPRTGAAQAALQVTQRVVGALTAIRRDPRTVPVAVYATSSQGVERKGGVPRREGS
jgi:hypothetical protein